MGRGAVAARAAMFALAAVSLGAMFPAVADAAVVFDAKPPADTDQTTAAFKFHDSSGRPRIAGIGLSS